MIQSVGFAILHTGSTIQNHKVVEDSAAMLRVIHQPLQNTPLVAATISVNPLAVLAMICNHFLDSEINVCELSVDSLVPIVIVDHPVIYSVYSQLPRCAQMTRRKICCRRALLALARLRCPRYLLAYSMARFSK